MRHYETLYIVNPNLAEEDHKGVIDKTSHLITKQKGVIVKIEEWGKQRLAYEVKKFDKGAYVLMEYCGDPGITAELERDLKLDDRVLKYQTVKVADQVDPQDLILKQKEAEKERVAAANEAQEKEEIEHIEEIAPTKEVNNGIQ